MSDAFKNPPDLPVEVGVIRQIAYLVDDIGQAMQQWQDVFEVDPFLIARDAALSARV